MQILNYKQFSTLQENLHRLAEGDKQSLTSGKLSAANTQKLIDEKFTLLQKNQLHLYIQIFQQVQLQNKANKRREQFNQLQSLPKTPKYNTSISKHSASKFQSKRLKVNRATFYVENSKGNVKFDNEYADDMITYMGPGFKWRSVPKRD